MRGPQPWKTNRARVLRAANVSGEGKLWSQLRNRQLGGFKFIRQAPVGPYFADFLCREANLIIEVDGGTHSEPDDIAADQVRQQALENLGYRIVRVWNADITGNIEGVREMLLAELKSQKCRERPPS
jgi:very-short-patch-repair endonuclease